MVIALGTNTVSNYKELLDQYVEKLPKGRRLILVTPYDGRYANDQSSESVQTRLYELELAKKYDFITIADWYQVAIENPNIWWEQTLFTSIWKPMVGNSMLKQSKKPLIRPKKVRSRSKTASLKLKQNKS